MGSFTFGVIFSFSFLSSQYYYSSKSSVKQFVYLTQNEGDPNLQYLKYLVSKRSDLITLSYKSPSHFEDTIFRPNTTWASGRNELYEEVQRREKELLFVYKYIIFLDGDLVAKCDWGSNGECWRAFEDFLLEYEPAVGAPNMQKAYNKDSPVSTAYYTEPYVTAIHHEARTTLLPYDTSKDNINWNIAPIVFMTKAVTFYTNHLLLFTRMNIRNQIHTKYPTTWYGQYWEVDEMIESIVPEELLCNYIKPRPKNGTNNPPFEFGDPIVSPGVVKKKNRSYSQHCQIDKSHTVIEETKVMT